MFSRREPARPILTAADIILDAKTADKWEAIRLVGNRLVEAGHVEPGYVDAMIEREKGFTTYVGNGLAIPHGVAESKRFIRSSGLAIAQFPRGIDFGEGNVAYLVIGIAGKGDQHLELLSSIALRCENPDEVKRLAQTRSAEDLLRAFL
ncbi:PTS sugar transporter subunit IIA [Symbiobacterium terraclitae]|uniref:PTS sugar transporter subunit IIA n=1 Tax=Symbiobacterium terraclitae TaxID=557451 RepID=UPI0035B55813